MTNWLHRYDFSKTWFTGSEIYRTFLPNFIKSSEAKQNKILEIGCFEGLSSVFFADNLLRHPESRLYCVDPYYTSGTVPGITSQFVNEEVRNRFVKNIQNSVHSTKIKFFEMTSDQFFESNVESFTFIYVDGNHEPSYITRDLENSFQCLEKDGIMWMDDYGGGIEGNIKNTIDKFLQKYDGQYTLIHKGYQIAIKKL